MKNVLDRRQHFREMFCAIFGDQWEKDYAPEHLVEIPIHGHKVASFMLGLCMADEWPESWPFRNIGAAWKMWHATFHDAEKSMWAIFFLNNGHIMAEHSATGITFIAAYHQFAHVLCQMFLCQAWYIANVNAEETGQ